jgi:YVTN family beta-propeller protein
MKFKTARFLACCVLAVSAWQAATANAEPRWRRPVALAAIEDRLYVANRDSGSVCAIDVPTQRVVAEHPVGTRLSDLAALPSGESLLATDESRHELLLLRIDGHTICVEQRMPVAAYPDSVVAASDGRLATVASLWSRRLSIVAIDEQSDPRSLRTVGQIDLPFAPRLQWLAADGNRLIVADAFGGEIAVVDLATQRLQSRWTIPGHNIRGLALSRDGRELHLVHQLLNPISPTTRSEVFWGGVVSNLFRSLPLERLLNETAMPDNDRPRMIHGSLVPLGGSGNAAGDPAGMLVTRRGQIAVAVAGTGEIAIRPDAFGPFARTPVGQRPTALAVGGPDDRLLFVANTLDDTISVVDLTTSQITTLSLGPTPPLTPRDRGEQLFYDARLSLDGWFSCHSCHPDGHTNGLLNDNFGDNTEGAAKRVPSLLGVSGTGPWAWNGSQPNLLAQIRKSLQTTMRGEEAADQAKRRALSEDEVAALAAFLADLSPPPSIARARQTLDVAAVERGRAVFHARNCQTCHAPPTFTTPDTYDVGLSD